MYLVGREIYIAPSTDPSSSLTDSRGGEKTCQFRHQPDHLENVMNQLQANFIYNTQPQRKAETNAELYQSHLASQSHRTLLPFYTRAKRKALRITTPKTARNSDCINALTTINTPTTDQIVNDWLAIHDPLNDTRYYNANVTDPDMDITSADEFADVDNEHEGLTITEPMDEVELIEFCTGYNVL
jgi:hypothetical protein